MSRSRVSPITRNNHYVPRLYLKHFASESGEIYRYRTLVPKPNIADWKKFNVSGVGYQSHLYTRALLHGESDEIEQWLSQEFETPAAKSIEKVVNNQRLGVQDYRLLVRFLASQMVRTPAFLIKNLPHWREYAENDLKNISKLLPNRTRIERTPSDEWQVENAKYYPLRVTIDPTNDQGKAIIRAETVVGRATWIYGMRHILTNTLDRLSDHRWTVLSSEDDLPWFTSDDPVVVLNFNSPVDYNFDGGWCVANTNIFLPLSPKHLLFTQVGDRKSYQRGDLMPRDQAMMIRKMMAEHAHRYIFSLTEDPLIPVYRPRRVDAQAVKNEQEQWSKWHDEQSAAERELLSGRQP